MSGGLKRALLVAGVVAAAVLMAWQVSAGLQQSNATAVRALQQSERHNEQLAAQANRASQLALAASRRAVHAQQLADVIANSRVQQCQDTNRKHHAAVRALDKLLRQAIRQNPRQRARIAQSRAGTLTLLNPILPVRNCSQFKPRP